MKPDYDYTRTLLDAFEASERWWMDSEALAAAGVEPDERLAFHILFLADHGVIASAEGDGVLGVKIIGAQTEVLPVPLRMTARGHEYLATLREPKALAAVKQAASGGFGVAMEVGRATLIALAMETLKGAGLVP